MRRGLLLGTAVTLASAGACGDADAPPAVAPAASAGPPDAGAPAAALPEHVYYLERDATTTGDALYWERKEGMRATLALGRDARGEATGTLRDEGGTADVVDSIASAPPWLELRRRTGSGAEWYRLQVVDGTILGRYARTSGEERPPLPSYVGHISGWLEDAFPATGASLSWDLALGDGRHARVRIARDGGGSFRGRFKVYAGPAVAVGAGEEQHFDPSGELLEEDLATATFDGARLSLDGAAAATASSLAHLDATASGRTLEGSATLADGTVLPFTGTRSAIASFGFLPRGDRDAWQASTRRRIANLMMNGDPAPHGECVATLGPQAPPFAPTSPCATDATCGDGWACNGGFCLPARRDDEPATHPQAYSLRELTLSCPMTNPFDGAPIASPRVVHGWVSTPTAAPPAAGYPVVLALNGHGGTARAVMTPDEPLGVFYYGEAFARRGYVVVAVDVKHHPDEEVDGEDGTHPAIVGDGFTTSDWEEDGERIWDLMRATDWVSGEADVDRTHLVVTGLSMGGEETTLLAALDPRFAMAIPAGYSPDMDVLLAIAGHNCWQWRMSNITEYFDQADLQALVSPRALLVQTGKHDPTYSTRSPPFSDDVQVMRRARAAWTTAEAANVGHYLHDDVHAYHFGGRRPGEAAGLGVTLLPAVVGSPPSFAWQISDATTSAAPTLFEFIALRGLGP
jgi:poly(3-hydroxybutyrate) depolymerase